MDSDLIRTGTQAGLLLHLRLTYCRNKTKGFPQSNGKMFDSLGQEVVWRMMPGVSGGRRGEHVRWLRK